MADDRNIEGSQKGLSHFLEVLFAEGQAVVAAGAPPALDEPALRVLEAWEENARRELRGDAPGFQPDAAGWAAGMIYSACQFVVCRDVGAEEIASAFAKKAPGGRSPSIDWSVDIVFRQLPEVYRLARHLSPTDPLIKELVSLAAAWPLSSVGIPNLGPVQLDSFMEQASLRQLYADRILAAGDLSRLGDPRVESDLREALGAYRELCPEVSRRLFAEESTLPYPPPKS